MRNQLASLLLAGLVHDCPKAGVSLSRWGTFSASQPRPGPYQGHWPKGGALPSALYSCGKTGEEKRPAPKRAQAVTDSGAQVKEGEEESQECGCVLIPCDPVPI